MIALSITPITDGSYSLPGVFITITAVVAALKMAITCMRADIDFLNCFITNVYRVVCTGSSLKVTGMFYNL